jgi:hypothetical protein
VANRRMDATASCQARILRQAVLTPGSGGDRPSASFYSFLPLRLPTAYTPSESSSTRETVPYRRHLKPLASFYSHLDDDDRLISPRPDLVGPSGEARNLAGEVGREVPSEFRELLSVVDPRQNMDVVAHHDVAEEQPFWNRQAPVTTTTTTAKPSA